MGNIWKGKEYCLLKLYVFELMMIESDARRFIFEAISAEKDI
jgi:hypothetical protein